MREAVITRHGDADVFELREAPDPIPQQRTTLRKPCS